MWTEEVIILSYQESWKDDFEKITQELRTVFGELVIRIEHVRSTAVGDIAAKPIIDIDAVVAQETDLSMVVEKLASIGYIHEGNLGIEGREALAYSGKEHLQCHHLYICPKNPLELKRRLAFRDYLRSYPDAVAIYGAIKMEAAQLFPKNIESYMAYKAPVIEEIYKELER